MNGTSGNVQIAIDAILSASHPHTFLGTSETGQSAILLTSGNPDCHIILRGGRQVTNYDSASVASTAEQMEKTGVRPRIMIDCSHANSGKDHRKQGSVCRAISEQVTSGERRIMGVMIESNLVAGAQTLVNGKALVYGQGITDACIDWPETHSLLRELDRCPKATRSPLYGASFILRNVHLSDFLRFEADQLDIAFPAAVYINHCVCGAVRGNCKALCRGCRFVVAKDNQSVIGVFACCHIISNQMTTLRTIRSCGLGYAILCYVVGKGRAG
jgi:hypothetical protein